MSVAAVSNSKVKSPYITVGGRDFAYQDSGTISTDENAKIFRELAKKGELEYAVVPGYGTEDDYEGIDVSGKVALVQRGGGMYYEQKERNAYAQGAIAWCTTTFPVCCICPSPTGRCPVRLSLRRPVSI